MLTHLMNDEGVCRTAPATPGLLIRRKVPGRQRTLDEIKQKPTGSLKSQVLKR